MALTCPRCNSQRIQKYSLIHRKGIADIDVTTVEAGSFFEASKSKGQSVSKLAQDCAPPPRMHYFFPMIFIVIIDAIINSAYPESFLAKVIMLLLLFGYPFLAFSYNRAVHSEEMGKWNRRFMCLVCEHTFESYHGFKGKENPKIRKTFTPSR